MPWKQQNLVPVRVTMPDGTVTIAFDGYPCANDGQPIEIPAPPATQRFWPVPAANGKGLAAEGPGSGGLYPAQFPDEATYEAYAAARLAVPVAKNGGLEMVAAEFCDFCVPACWSDCADGVPDSPRTDLNTNGKIVLKYISGLGSGGGVCSAINNLMPTADLWCGGPHLDPPTGYNLCAIPTCQCSPTPVNPCVPPDFTGFVKVAEWSGVHTYPSGSIPLCEGSYWDPFAFGGQIEVWCRDNPMSAGVSRDDVDIIIKILVCVSGMQVYWCGGQGGCCWSGDFKGNCQSWCGQYIVHGASHMCDLFDAELVLQCQDYIDFPCTLVVQIGRS